MRCKHTLTAARTAFAAVTVPLIGLLDEMAADGPKEPKTLPSATCAPASS